MVHIRLDLNNPDFQTQLVALTKPAQTETLGTFRKLLQMSWVQIYQDRGLNWEKIESRRGPHAQALYSFRISRKIRALGYRDGDYLRVLSIHEDHDSAYEKR